MVYSIKLNASRYRYFFWRTSMKKPNDTFLNMMLVFGLLFIFAGFLFLVGFTGGNIGTAAFSVYPLLVCFAGFVFLYIYFGVSKTPFKLFVGMSFVLNGLFCLLVSRGAFNMTMKEYWPVLVIVTGVSLFVAGRTKGRHLILPYDLPGAIFLFMGVIFLLFSLGIIQMSLAQMAVMSVPVILILTGVILVVLFCKRKALLDFLPDDLSEELSGKKDEDETQDFDSGEDL